MRLQARKETLGHERTRRRLYHVRAKGEHRLDEASDGGPYELTESARLGPSPKDDKEVKILNRLVRWTERGLEYEGDPRQVEQVVVDLGLEGAKTVGTPGVKADRTQHEADVPLEKSKHTAYRAVSARCNFVSMDRPEVQFASKELCRWMSQPAELGLTGLKRLGRFFEGQIHQRWMLHARKPPPEVLEQHSRTSLFLLRRS